MKAKILIFVFFFLILAQCKLTIIYAADNNASAELIPNVIALQNPVASNDAHVSISKKDHREEILRDYLEKWNSPLAQYAHTFIEQADLYNLPWNLVPAVAGTESTFAQQVPQNCNNPFGFGIFTGHMTCFSSYDEAIKVVSKSLREDYIDKYHLSSLEDIGHMYASSDAWPVHTLFFINQMEQSKLDFDSKQIPALPISL